METPLWERLVVAATGPVVTAALALLVLNSVTGRLELRRENEATRERLATEMTATAVALYMATQRFWRAARRIKREDRRASEQLGDALERVDDAYESTRVSMQRLERELKRFFTDPTVSETWHQVDDLLTVRYFQLTSDTDLAGTYRENALNRGGKKHSGLTIEQMDERNPKLVLDTYREALSAALELVRTSEFAGSPRWWRAGGHP